MGWGVKFGSDWSYIINVWPLPKFRPPSHTIDLWKKADTFTKVIVHITFFISQKIKNSFSRKTFFTTHHFALLSRGKKQDRWLTVSQEPRHYSIEATQWPHVLLVLKKLSHKLIIHQPGLASSNGRTSAFHFSDPNWIQQMGLLLLLGR